MQRSKSPGKYGTKKYEETKTARAAKKKPVKNTYDIIQFKKLIGKDIIKPYCGVVLDKKTMVDEAKKVRDKILSGGVKNIYMVGYVNNGITYVFSGTDRLHCINAISYADLKKAQVELEIHVMQYGKLTKDEILALS